MVFAGGFSKLFGSVQSRTVALAFLCLPLAVGAQSVPPRAYSVEVTASISSSPPYITLNWPADSSATGYQIARKAIHDISWSADIHLPGNATTWSDINAASESGYEYKVV